MTQPSRRWKFRVNCPTYPGETVCVSGDCSKLGNWKHDKAFVLQASSSSVWSGVAKLPLRDVRFRFFVCMILDNPNPGDGRVIIVRRWETHLDPRLIRKDEEQEPADQGSDDVFGFLNGAQRIETGWLTAENVVQFKISNGPINFWRRKHKNSRVRLKMMPLNLSRQNSMSEFHEPNSADFQDSSTPHDPNPNWPIIEVAAINETEYHFCLQDQFGRIYNAEEILVFQAQVILLDTVAYMIDFYMDVGGDPIPQHIGFCHILPGNIKDSFGTLVQPISSIRQEPIGQIIIEYVVIRPLKECPCDLSISYSKHWKHAWTGLDIGHRGSGTSKKNVKKCATVRENTIASLQAATDHGADFVEFDVQLSKDLVPVLFHDFHVNIGLNQKARQGGGFTALRIPVKDLTLAQLHELKIFWEDGCGCVNPFQTSHEAEMPNEEADTSESDHHEPFPTLQLALETVSVHSGFNIEIKWTMQLKDGSYELNYPFELNLFIDIVLDTVLKYAGKRRIVFSCFHPDICVMLRLKQNKYPVIFLTQGVTSKYPEYNDPRTQNTPVAINFALFAGILGLNMHTEDILRDPTLVKTALSHGLITFCWGEDNNNVSTIKYLKDLGLNGIIYDRIEEHMEPKESIFLSDDGSDLLQLASCLSPTSPVYANEDSHSHFPGMSEGEQEDTSAFSSLGNGKFKLGDCLLNPTCTATNSSEIEEVNLRTSGVGLMG